MKRLITGLTAALLAGAPLATLADDDDRRQGRHGHHWSGHPGNGWKHGHPKHGYRSAPVYVERYYYPAPRIVVPAPVYVPVPGPHPYAHLPRYPANGVNIGFRIFF